MINVTNLQPHLIRDAKYVIASVAQRIYRPEQTPQQFYDLLEKEGELQDVDNYQQVYIADRGLFLIVLDDDKLIGTGAIKNLGEKIAELKRIWLLEEYHGQKIGFNVVTRLLNFAYSQGYEKVRLQTGEKQDRALRFYEQLGFRVIDSYRENMDNISMELELPAGIIKTD
jgi:putative acetyltransferase